MEKKFDFKTIAIACLLFFGFVFLLFYKFSSADDAVNHYTTAIEIFDSQQSFEDFKSTLPNKILPEWYSESESIANLLDTIACFCIGDYLQVGSNVVQELSGQITGDPLFLEHFVFDYDSLCWIFDSDTDDFIKSSLESVIYESDGPVVGNWYSVPWSFVGGGYTWNVSDVSSNSAPVYVCLVDSGWNYGVYIASFVNGQSAVLSGSLTATITTSNRYQGSVSVGFWQSYGMSGAYRPSNVTMYSSSDSALADLFGWDGTTDSDSLIEGVSIRNEDFTVKPLSYPASVLVDYPNEITYPDYDPDDTRLTFEYTYNMEVPFWLKNPTTEPTSYELPTDYDFGNIEFEYEADPSYLAGAGIVQDVFEVLPSSLQGLIFLFGAGSLAFIFLRR